MNKILFFSFLLLLPLILTSNAYALSETECESLSNLSEHDLGFTVITCDLEFDVIVNMGQRLQFQNPEGGSANMLPSASVGGPTSTGPGVYQYNQDGFSGTVTLQNPPDVGIVFENVQTSFSGSQLSVSGDIVNNNNFAVKDFYVYWHVSDDSGNYLSAWQPYGSAVYSAEIPAQSSNSFSETMCCGNEGTVTPYLVQAFQNDGTPLIDVPIYVSNIPEPTPEIDSQTLSVAVDGVNYSVDVRTENVTVSNITPDVDFKSIILSIDVPQNTGILEIDLDREFFDSTFQGTDDDFNIIVDGNQPNFTEIETTSQSRTLSIELTAGSEEIEIIGSVLGQSVEETPVEETPVEETPVEETPVEETPVEESSETGIDARATKTNYGNGDSILILGSITGYDSSSGKGLTYIITSPDDKITNLGQMNPDSDGSFSMSFIAGGSLWKLAGDYVFEFHYGADSTKVVINYVGGEAVISDEPEPTPEQEHEEELEIISLSTKKSQYRTGDTIVITGKVNTSDFSKDVVLQVFNGGSLVDIAQVSVSLNESFSHTVIAEGSLWKENGKYTINASYGDDTEDTSFIYRYTDSTPQPEPALDYEVIIVPAQGSGAPGCEDTSQGCYHPKIQSVALGGKVIMENTDSAAHTFTSGTPTGGPDGVFDSGLAMAGSIFEWNPHDEGLFPYFCMVHPWMIGTILVGEGTAPPTPEPTPDTDIDLEVSVNERVYDLGDIVGITVDIEGTTGSQKVAVGVTDPRGNSVISRSFTFTSDDIAGEIEFKISEEFKTGTYTITATTSDDGKTIKDTSHFKIKSQFNSFKITNVDVTDQQGNPSDLEAGDIGFIKVNLESSKSISTLVTVNLFDSELTSIGIGSVKTTLSSGNSEIILSFMIPADASLGPANIYVNSFSDWPSNGGIPLTSEVSVVENIQ